MTPATALKDLRTRDLDEAHELIDDVFTPHSLVFAGRPTVDLRLQYGTSPRLTLGELRYGTDVKVEVPPPETSYHLALPLQGACIIGQGRETVSIAAGARGALMSSDEPLSVHWSPDSVQYILKISRASIDHQLTRLTGRAPDGPVHFDLEFDLGTPAIQALLSTVDFLRHELDRSGGLTAVPLAREHLEWSIVTQILTAVPHDHSHLLEATGAGPRGRIPELIEYIEEHPEEDLSPGHLAQLAGITERTLQLGFRKALGTTPAAYVRSVRLDRVHEQLCAGLQGSTIADVAMRWGFFHPSRFASQYRERFGVLPSQTAGVRESAAGASGDG